MLLREVPLGIYVPEVMGCVPQELNEGNGFTQPTSLSKSSNLIRLN